MDPLIKSQLLYQLSYAPCAPSCAGRVLYQSGAVLSSKGQRASVGLSPGANWRIGHLAQQAVLPGALAYSTRSRLQSIPP